MLGAFWRYLKHCLRQYGRDNCPQLAAAISYYVLFSIVPLTFVVVSAFGLVIRSEKLRSEVVEQVVNWIQLEKGEVELKLDEGRLLQRLDSQEIGGIRAELTRLNNTERQRIADSLSKRGEALLDNGVLEEREVIVRYDNSVSDTLDSVARAGGPLTALSLVVSLWTASAMFGAVRRAVNVVWNVDYERPYLRQKLLDMVMVFSFGLLLLGSVGSTAALRALRGLSDDTLGPISSGTGLFWGALPYVLPGLVSFAVFGLLYRCLPAASVRFRDVWFGALVAAVLFELLKTGFAFYVANIRAYDLLYGSLGGILLFLTGIYFAAAILLLGSELARAMPSLKAGAFAVPRDPSTPKPRLIEEIRREAVKFIRGLILAPRR